MQPRSQPHQPPAPPPSHQAYVSRVVDLLDPGQNRIGNMSVEEARRRVLSGDPAAVREIDGRSRWLPSIPPTRRRSGSRDRWIGR
jgi:asparagine synthase (glutamine-hydrolysing)